MLSFSTNKLLAGAIFYGLLTFAPTASASVIFDFHGVITGETPSGSPPWLRVTFVNNGANTVTMTIDNLLPAGPQFVTDLFVNVDPALSAVNVAYVSGQDTIARAQTAPGSLGNPSFGSTYEMFFDWETANNANRFIGGEQAVFSLSAAGLNENSFSFTAASNNGTNYMSAHVQGIPTGVGSGRIRPNDPVSDDPIVPEPSTLGFVALATGLGLLVRKVRH